MKGREKFNSIYDVVKKVVVLAVIISLTVTVVGLSYKCYSKNVDLKGIYITTYKIKRTIRDSKGDRCSVTQYLYKRVKYRDQYHVMGGFLFRYHPIKEKNDLLAENEIATDIDCNIAAGLLSKDNLKIIP